MVARAGETGVFIVGVGVSILGPIVSAMRGGHRLHEDVGQASAA
jgi:hypothetical protein